VTQAAAVDELRKTNPNLSRWALYRSGLRVGRDHVASIVNTLVLAYAGAALPLLLLFLISRQPAGLVLNSEAIAAEVVRSLVGSIGLVACVPLTTWLAAYIADGAGVSVHAEGRSGSAPSSPSEAAPQSDSVTLPGAVQSRAPRSRGSPGDR
jgi:hypothetical protein